MNYNRNTKKEIEKACNLCKGNFFAWLTTLNYEKEKEENVKNHMHNYCPACRVFEKRIKKV